MVLDGKSLQKYPVNAGDPQGSILVHLVSLQLLYISDLPDNGICNIGSYPDDITLFSPVSVIRHLFCGNN